MTNFLSRLVERTFGLVPVAQPVTHSIFAPERSVKSDSIQDFAHASESMSNHNGVNIDVSRKTSIVPQSDYHPQLNLKKPFNEDEAELTAQIKDGDNRIHFASTSRSLHNIKPLSEPLNEPLIEPLDEPLIEPLDEPLIEPLKQNDSGTQEPIESVHFNESMPLQKQSKKDKRYLHTPPAELGQNSDPLYTPLYTIDSDTVESADSELQHIKNRNEKNRIDRSNLQLVPKSILHEEQSHEAKKDFQKHLEPIIDSVNSLSGKTLIDYISDSSQTAGSLSSLKGDEFLVKNREPASRINLESTSRANSGPTSRTNFGPTSRSDFYSPSYLFPDAISSPIIPSKQNLKLISTPKVNTPLEQTGNILIEQHAAEPKSPSTVPIIKVTIGRIEVKAVKPPQEPQPQNPPQRQPPVLSLDDYLKQYNG